MAAVGTFSQNSLFYQAIEAVLGGWTALQLAVEHGFGGPHSQEKATWMVSVIEQWFIENEGIEAYELEDFIADVMNSEFNTVTDDSSLPEVAKTICGYHRLYKDGEESKIRSQLSSLPRANTAQCQQDGEEEDEDMEESVDPNEVANHMQNLQLQQQNHCTEETSQGDEDLQDDDENQEEDGWTCVKRKGKKR